MIKICLLSKQSARRRVPIRNHQFAGLKRRTGFSARENAAHAFASWSYKINAANLFRSIRLYNHQGLRETQ
jgi:hypothetical protein